MGRWLQTQRRIMKNTLYLRLALAFLILVVLQSISLLFIWHYTSQQYSNEITQRLNEDIAMYITGQHQLIQDGVVNDKELEVLANRAMVINPTVEVYLLSPNGEIISDLVAKDQLQFHQVDLNPVHRLLNEHHTLPILGINPKQSNQERPISVSPIMDGDQLQGYLYAILGGEVHSGIVASVKNSHILTTGAFALGLNFVVTILAATLIFFFMTKRLRRLSGEVKSFHVTNFKNFQDFIESSSKSIRTKNASGDEIDQLSMCVLAMVKHMKEQFEHIQAIDAERRDLIANISHDLKTPLATVQGYVETVLIKERDGTKLSNEDRAQYLSTALNQSNKLASLIDELFELAKLESGAITPSLEVFSLKELIHDSMQDASWSADQKNIQFFLEAEDQPFMVKADIALIQRVLQNLMDNAINYSPANSRVTIQIDDQQNKTVLHVIDEGKGILAEDIPYIFERYYRCQQQQHSSKLGTGLGLAIVKKICDLHESSITVSSELGKGSIFSFELSKTDYAVI